MKPDFTAETQRHKEKPIKTALVEGADYYLERWRMVFTAEFLRKRVSCCESGCRHCPYGFGPEGLRAMRFSPRE